MGLGRDVNDIVGHDSTAVDRCREFDGVDRLEFLSGREDVEFAIFGSDPNFAVSYECRAPDAGLGFVFPVLLAGFGVETMDVAFVFGSVNEAVCNTHGGDGPTDVFGGPDHFAISTETSHDADAVAVLRVLPGDDVNLIFSNDGGADDFAGTGVGRVFDGLTLFFTIVGWVGVMLPEFLEDAESFFVFFRDGIEGIGEPVATAPGDGVLAVERSMSWR